MNWIKKIFQKIRLRRGLNKQLEKEGIKQANLKHTNYQRWVEIALRLCKVK